MKILVSGASGMVGAPLVEKLQTEGNQVVRLARGPRDQASEKGFVWWDPERGELDASRFDGVEAVIHLAGENVGQGRWTPEKKQRIRDSRVLGTSLLARTISSLKTKPECLICASATGYYGDRGNEILTETSAPGSDFLAQVCCDWEKAAAPAGDAGIRVVFLRLGIILGRQGGALAKMLPIFKLGLGGRFGTAEQYWPWISIKDAVKVAFWAIQHREVQGPINVVAPQSVTNREFTKAFGRAVRRPAFFPVPAWVARLVVGEMAGPALLASTRATPAKLLENGYQFADPSLDGAIQRCLSAPGY